MSAPRGQFIILSMEGLFLVPAERQAAESPWPGRGRRREGRSCGLV